jgi:uncharacterized protein (TIGR02646 family)
MIYINRYRIDNAKAIQPSPEWFTTATNLTSQAIKDGPSHVIHDHYKHISVKMALEKLFHHKCAYCEGKPTSQGPWDVEHYRPKGRVKESDNHHGYYWLAYTWENLFLSCTYCNQNRTDQPLFDDPTVGATAGKVDQFPLRIEKKRAMKPESKLDEEEPLLLNPCKDVDCETYFRYDIKGHILAVDTETPIKKKRAKKTIRICHLDRRRLREARGMELQRIIKAVKAHELAKENEDVDLIQVTRELVDLYTADSSPFAGMARFVDHNRHAFFSTL